MRRIVITMLTSLFVFVSLPSAAGGGSWMSPSDDYIRPGDEVSLVGYVHAPLDDVHREWVATLYGPNTLSSGGPEVMVLGPVTIELTGLGGYLSYRVSIDFVLPRDLELGHYSVQLDSGTEGEYLGDMIGAGFPVGVPFDHPLWLEWALDDPKIADLPDDAVIAGPGFDITAAELRAGVYPGGAADFLLDPSILGQRGAVVKPRAPEPAPRSTVGLGIAEEPVEVTSAPVIEEEAPAAPAQQGAAFRWWPATLIGMTFLGGLLVMVRRSRETRDQAAEDWDLVSSRH